MKINEIEELLNTPRANIRYYEKEGLLSVTRKENGYRNYSDEDVARLKKIIIFRKLGISVQQIKELLNGDIELSQVLDESISELEKQINELNGAVEVSKYMKNNKVSADDLDEVYYWNLINENEREGRVFFDTWQDFLDTELDVFDIMWKRVFFLNSKKIRDRWGYKKFFILIFVILIIRGLVKKFLLHESFLDGFLYPIFLFLIVSTIFIPVILIAKKFPKTGRNIMNVIFVVCCLILALMIVGLLIVVIRGVFFN